jgi:hypothetical protein
MKSRSHLFDGTFSKLNESYRLYIRNYYDTFTNSIRYEVVSTLATLGNAGEFLKTRLSSWFMAQLLAAPLNTRIKLILHILETSMPSNILLTPRVHCLTRAHDNE